MSTPAVFQFTDVDGIKSVIVKGEVDLANANDFRHAVLDENDQPRVELVDLTECAYMDSTGLSVMVRLQKQLKQPLRVAIASKSMLNRVLTITGLDHSFDITRRDE